MIRGVLTGTVLGTVGSAALLLGLNWFLPVVEIEAPQPGRVEAAFGLEPPVSVVADAPELMPVPSRSVAVSAPAQGAPAVSTPARPALEAPVGPEIAVARSEPPAALRPRLSDVPPVVAGSVTGPSAPTLGASIDALNADAWGAPSRAGAAVPPAPPAQDPRAIAALAPPMALRPSLSDVPPPAGVDVSSIDGPTVPAAPAVGPAVRIAPSRVNVTGLPEAPSPGTPVIASAEPPLALRPRLSDDPPQAGLRAGGPAQPGAPGLTQQEAVLAPWSPSSPVLLPPRAVPAGTQDVDTIPRSVPSGPAAPPILAQGPALEAPVAGAVPTTPEALAPAGRSERPAGPLSGPSTDAVAEALPPLPAQAGALTETAALPEPTLNTDPQGPSGIAALNPPVVDAALSQPVPVRPPVSGEAPAPLGAAEDPAPRVLPRITVVGQEQPPEAPSDAEPEQPALVANAVAFEPQGDAPLLGVVLIDGPAAAGLDLTALPFPLAVAVDPLAPGAMARMSELRAAGLEVLVLAPVVPGAQAADLEIFFEAVFTAVPEAVAVMDVPDSALQRQRSLAGHTVSILKASGHGFVTYDKGLNAAVRLAEREAVPVAKVARVFDEKGTEGFAARRMLDQGAFQAGRDGGAVLLGGLTAQALEALALWQQSSKGRSVQFAPISAVLSR